MYYGNYATLANAIQNEPWTDGDMPIVRTATGSATFWFPEPDEILSLQAGEPLLLAFPSQSIPQVTVQILKPSTSAPDRGIPASLGWSRYIIMSGPRTGEEHVAVYGRLVTTEGDETNDLYVHIEGNPAYQLEHARTWLIDNTPGADYAEISSNINAERAEVEAFKDAVNDAFLNGQIPPSVTGLSIPMDRISAQFAMLSAGFPAPSIGP